MVPPAELAMHQTDAYNHAAYRLVVAGIVLIVFGLAMTLGTVMLTAGGYPFACFGPMVLGAAFVGRGLTR